MTAFSAGLFFCFVILCVCRFGLLSCYSAYGPRWMDLSSVPGFNWWSVVTTFTALLLVPPLIEAGNGSAWQFFGFLCPALIAFVGLTPDYGRNKLAGRVHTVCAALGALFSVLFIVCVYPHLWWVPTGYAVIAAIATLRAGLWSWCFWFEMAAYLAIFTTMFLIIA